MKYQFIKHKLVFWIPVIVFVFFSVWWLYLRNFDLDQTRDMRQLWGAIYQVIALFGAVVGFSISHKWGGYKSMLGKSIAFFSIGLLLQSFGQSYSSYYVYSNHVEIPSYPGIGDIGFFGSVLSYIYGAILLSRVSGAKASLKKLSNKITVFVLPLLILFISYFFFLKGYEFDWTNKIKIFLDFGYPFGQALYVSIAILALIMSRNLLGGIMKKPILLIIFALLFQYASDFFFLYQANAGVWYVANINDYLYCASYFIMTMSLIQIGATFEQIKNS